MKGIGLILEGGANRGIFTAGVLDFFQEQKLYFPYVVSVSVGSCNALDYISGQAGRTKSCIIPGSRNIPPIHWRHLRSKKSVVNLDMVFDEYPNRLVPFDYDSYFSSPIINEFVVTNCENGQAQYLSESEDRSRLMQICRASSSMPYLSPMVMLDGVPYLDGGIADAVPIRHAMSRGYEKNIVILTREKGYLKKDSKAARMLNRRFYKAYPDLIRTLESRFSRYNQTMRELEQLEAEGKVLIIRPDKVLAGRMDNNASHLEDFYRQGYEVAERHLEEIKRIADLR